MTQAVDRKTVDEILSDWSEMPKRGAHTMLGKYGVPDEAVPSRLIWHNNGPWKRTIVYRNEIPHNFPDPHPDFLEQTIDYSVPIEKLEEIARYDCSIIVDRTPGEVSSRCDREFANILALNVMDDIVRGKRSASEARRFYAETAVQYLQFKKPSNYTEKFLFQTSNNDTAYPDESALARGMMDAGMEKIMETMAGAPGRDR